MAQVLNPNLNHWKSAEPKALKLNSKQVWAGAARVARGGRVWHFFHAAHGKEWPVYRRAPPTAGLKKIKKKKRKRPAGLSTRGTYRLSTFPRRPTAIHVRLLFLDGFVLSQSWDLEISSWDFVKRSTWTFLLCVFSPAAGALEVRRQYRSKYNH